MGMLLQSFSPRLLHQYFLIFPSKVISQITSGTNYPTFSADLPFCCVLQDLFPFKAYFADAPSVLFAGQEYEADLEKAWGCWRHLKTMFQELEECRAFELLKVGSSWSSESDPYDVGEDLYHIKCGKLGDLRA